MHNYPLLKVIYLMTCFVLVALIPGCATAVVSENNTSVYMYKVQEDPYFTFGYPSDMILNVTVENGRDTYSLHTDKTPSARFMVTSMENPEWLVLPEDSLVSYERSARQKYIINGTYNETLSPGRFNQDDNTSTYLISYPSQDEKELIFSYIISTPDDIIYAMLREPVRWYHTDYGDFLLKSLFSITPRAHNETFTYTPVDAQVQLNDALNELSGGEDTKDFVYDPYAGLFMDTGTGYYYIPNLGVFFDPKTNTFHYPSEFGAYDENYFKNYIGQYSPSGTGTSGYYDGLYAGYDASSIIQDVYQNRQNVYDAANAMWTDYIRDNQYYAVDSSGNTEPIDTIQEYQDYGLS